MWIRTTREAHAGNAFLDPRVGELNDGKPVSFTDNGAAQVSAEVGEYLTTEYDAFVPSHSGDGIGEEDDSGVDLSEADDEEDTD